MNQNELYHFGVLGMKWGVRRWRNGYKSPNSKHQAKTTHRLNTREIHDDYRRAHTRKSIKSMSDDELRKRINRLEMESKYRNLSSNSVNKGRNRIKRMNDIMKVGIDAYRNVDTIMKISKAIKRSK